VFPPKCTSNHPSYALAALELELEQYTGDLSSLQLHAVQTEYRGADDLMYQAKLAGKNSSIARRSARQLL
jgi:hypothetical protein